MATGTETSATEDVVGVDITKHRSTEAMVILTLTADTTVATATVERTTEEDIARITDVLEMRQWLDSSREWQRWHRQ
jgi:hypothetical protein